MGLPSVAVPKVGSLPSVGAVPKIPSFTSGGVAKPTSPGGLRPLTNLPSRPKVPLVKTPPAAVEEPPVQEIVEEVVPVVESISQPPAAVNIDLTPLTAELANVTAQLSAMPSAAVFQQEMKGVAEGLKPLSQLHGRIDALGAKLDLMIQAFQGLSASLADNLVKQTEISVYLLNVINGHTQPQAEAQPEEAAPETEAEAQPEEAAPEAQAEEAAAPEAEMQYE
jgi:hypothetical protein